jgi:hypothetical protein
MKTLSASRLASIHLQTGYMTDRHWSPLYTVIGFFGYFLTIRQITLRATVFPRWLNALGEGARVLIAGGGLTGVELAPDQRRVTAWAAVGSHRRWRPRGNSPRAFHIEIRCHVYREWSG